MASAHSTVSSSAEPERGGVGGGHRRGERVGVDGVHPDAGAGGGERVGADTAAEVGEGPYARGVQPCRAPLRHDLPGRLLQTVPG